MKQEELTDLIKEANFENYASSSKRKRFNFYQIEFPEATRRPRQIVAQRLI